MACKYPSGTGVHHNGRVRVLVHRLRVTGRPARVALSRLRNRQGKRSKVKYEYLLLLGDTSASVSKLDVLVFIYMPATEGARPSCTSCLRSHDQCLTGCVRKPCEAEAGGFSTVDGCSIIIEQPPPKHPSTASGASTLLAHAHPPLLN